MALCLVPMGPQERVGLPQPVAGIAWAQPVMVRRFAAVPAQIGDSGLQGIDKVRERRIERGLASVQVQPAARLTEAAARAATVPTVEITLQVAVTEIHLALDVPAWEIEQRGDVSGNRTCLPAAERIHESPIPPSAA